MDEQQPTKSPVMKVTCGSRRRSSCQEQVLPQLTKKDLISFQEVINQTIEKLRIQVITETNEIKYMVKEIPVITERLDILEKNNIELKEELAELKGQQLIDEDNRIKLLKNTN